MFHILGSFSLEKLLFVIIKLAPDDIRLHLVMFLDLSRIGFSFLLKTEFTRLRFQKPKFLVLFDMTDLPLVQVEVLVLLKL
jgi:hypothetical protein